LAARPTTLIIFFDPGDTNLLVVCHSNVNTTQIDPLPPEQCDPLQTPFQKSLIGS